jgi:prepilin-type N-terminal cleavage/methylation domain-containing protein
MKPHFDGASRNSPEAPGAMPSNAQGRRDRGFTLLELMFATALLAITIVGTMIAIAEGNRQAIVSREDAIALQVADQMMAAADAIENEGVNMAPGSAPFLAAAGITASVKSQAMMQRMIAAAIRQEAARVAHDNTVRKRNAMFGAQFRNDMQTIFKK